MQPTTTTRLRDVEARQFRTEAAIESINGQLSHLVGAASDLSGDLRALRHEVRTEIVPRLDGIDGRLDGIGGRLDRIEADVAELKTDMAGVKAGVGALLAHFNITPPTA